MTQENPSSSETPRDEKDILDLTANRTDPAEEAGIVREEPAEMPLPPGDMPEPAAASPDDAVVTPPAQVKSASAPAMIGAGILGGLVALAAAFSMQYAGYLPSASPEQARSVPSEDIAALRAEIDGLKQQLTTIPADLGGTEDLQKRIAALEAGGSEKAASAEDAAAIQALQSKLSSLEAAQSQAAQETGQTVADLTTRLAAAEKTLKEKPGEAAVSKAIAATYLKAAVDRGDPFLTELETFASLAKDDPGIAELRPLAAAGVKSRAMLAKEFDAVAQAIIDAGNAPLADQSMTDRLLASARSLVSVRPVGNVEGNDAGAIVARMEDKLKNGDLKGASLEWDGLPDEGKKASAAFKTELDTRIKVDEIVRALAQRSATAAIQAG